MAALIGALIGSMAFHRHTSVDRYVTDPWTPCRRQDLDSLSLPARPERSRLAGQLTTEAAWYLQLDTPAAQLVAWKLLREAGSAEWHGAETVQDLVDAEAAWAEACERDREREHDRSEPWRVGSAEPHPQW